MILLKILDIYLWLDARLRRNTNMNIARFIEIGCYKGFRHKDNLPCRGQRTRTNAATRKKLKLILAL
jgi:small subunit ribosomal protein S13